MSAADDDAAEAERASLENKLSIERFIDSALEKAKTDSGEVLEDTFIKAMADLERSNQAEFARKEDVLKSLKNGLLTKVRNRLKEWKDKNRQTAKEPGAARLSPSVIERFDKLHSIAISGGKSFVTITNDDGSLTYWTTKAFHDIYADQTITNDKGKIIPVSEIWFTTTTKRYRSVNFDPRGTPNNVLNLWRGFGVEKIPGLSSVQAARGCRLLLTHIRENVCNGSRAEYRYFIRWCADMIQRPHIKGGVAVSISGRKGAGKSKVAEALSALLGVNRFTVSHSEQLVGRFNAHLAQSLLVVAEEALWAGDKSAGGPLKHMITSSDFALERKGVDIVGIKSYARIMFIGNMTWMFPADEDERRLFALECGDKQMQKVKYFKAIDRQLYGHDDGQDENPNWRECMGIRSFMTYLSLIDISKFDIRKIPETKGLRNQRQETLEPAAEFFYNRLAGATIGFEPDPVYDIKRRLTWGEEMRIVPKYDIYEYDYVQWHKQRHKSHPVSLIAFWKVAKKIFNWENCRVGGKDKQVYAVKVLGRAESIKAFVEVMKVNPPGDGEDY